MADAMPKAMRLEHSIGGVRVMCFGSRDGTGANGCPVCAEDARIIARRDAAWREAVERVRKEHDAFCATMRRDDFCTCGAYENNAALDALLAAMEGK